MNKLLFILHTPPPVHGSSMVGQYIKESQVVNQSFDCQYINLGTSRTIDEIGKNPIGKISRYLLVLGQVFVQLVRFKPDLCYLAITAKGIGFYKDAFVALIVKLLGVKLVYHFHNKGVSTRQEKWLDNLLYRFVFKNADVILLSKYLYPDIQKYVPERRVHYCPNGIEKQLIVDSEQLTVNRYQKYLNSQQSTPEILFLSNLIESKGVFVLLEACKILKNKKINFHCVFVGGIGDVSEQQFKSKVVELKLTDNVHYAGKKYGKEKEEAFVYADIFVHPSYNDCFPLVLLEAMQFWLPIVSTFEGGIPDVVDDGVTGFLVPQKDVEALAEKLAILIKYPALRQKMGEKGRMRYEDQFALNTFENRLNDILSSI